MDKLELQLVEIIDQLQGLAKPAMGLLLESIRATAIIDLIQCLIMGGIVAAMFIVAKKFWSKYMIEKPKMSNYDVSTWGVAAFATSVAAVFLSFWVVAGLTSSQMWLGIFAPELALAQQILDKAI